MALVFWFSLLPLLQSYIIYPLSLPLLNKIFGRKQEKKSNSNYKVSMILAAHNEEDIIEEKLKNCHEIDYPKGNLEIIIGSDASTDKTNEILKQHGDGTFIKPFFFDERTGKSGILNKLILEAKGDIILFCDANSMLLKNALQKLVENFSNDKTGCVCGRLTLRDNSDTSLGEGESFYWRFESEIKRMEGNLGTLIGANGGIYAIRRELFKPIPENKNITDDFFIASEVLLSGYHSIYEPQAIATEETSVETFGEFKRKVRIGEANFNMFFYHLKLLNPLFPLTAYSFFSHKILRWLGPCFMILALLSNALMLLGSPSVFYKLTLGLQVIFYALALIGAIFNQVNKKSSIFFTVPFYFTSMNLALFIGMLKSFTSKDQAFWDRTQRA